MSEITRQIPVVTGVTREIFEREIMPGHQPMVMKGLARDWPSVQAALTSDQVSAAYFKALDIKKQTVMISLLPPELKGRFFYKPDMTGFNFRTEKRDLAGFLDWLVTHTEREDLPTVYAQSMPTADILPGFEAENPMPLLTQSYGPRLWLGSRVRTQTHFDPSHNIAVLVAGKRRFTLFPPDQVANLYPGPFDTGPGGVPVSLASIEEPDFERFPRLAEALKVGQYADLEPGDALYIPYAWWHHVQSSGGYNALVNYWWNEGGDNWVSPYAAFFSAILALRDLAPEQKAIWRNLLDLYVFDDAQTAVTHIPEPARSVFGPITSIVRQKINAFLKMTLKL